MRYTDYLRGGTLSALFLALFVPFIVAVGSFWPNMFFPYITGKNFAFRILVEVALACYVLLAIKEPKYRPRASMLMWAALAFVAWMGLATALSVDPVKSLWSNFERMEGYVGLVHLFVWFVVAGAVLSADKLWNALFNTSIAASVLQGCMALFQALNWFGFAPSSQSGTRADTTFGNATYLAVYLLVNFFITLYMLAQTKGSRNTNLKVFYGIALVLQFTGILFTETRGALLGVVAGLIVAAAYYIIFARGAEAQKMRRISIGALLALVVIGGVIYAARDTQLVRDVPGLRRVASISLTEITVISRLQYIWPMALKGGMERPLTGWGQENFNFVFNKYYEPGMYNQEAWFDRAHNQFLDWLIAGGVPAFLLYVSLYALALWAVWRSNLSVGEKAAFVGLLAGYAFHNLFVFDNLVSAMYFFVLLGFFHSLVENKKPSLAFSKPGSDHAVAIAAPVVLIGGLLIGWSLNAPGLARAQLLVNAIQTQEAGLDASGNIVGVAKDPKKNLAQFKEALGPVRWPGNPLGMQETTEQFLQYASQVGPQTNIDPQVKFDIFGGAADAIDALLKSRPGDARLELFAATFLAQYGQTEPALTHLEKALEFSPRKQQILIQLGLTRIQMNDKEGALSVLRQAYESAPGFESARIFYAAGLYFAGDMAAGDALLTEQFGSPVVDNQQLLQVFMNLKLYDRAIAIWKKRLEASPEDVQTRLGLASTYFAACRVSEVVAELQTIARKQPQSALEMQNLIKQIQDGTLKCGQ